jgi:hypothetical protein
VSDSRNPETWGKETWGKETWGKETWGKETWGKKAKRVKWGMPGSERCAVIL